MVKRALPARLVLVALVAGTVQCGKGGLGARRSNDLGDACAPAEKCATACESGDETSCYVAGIRYEVGDGAEQDYERAATYYERACNAGAAGGCNNLGVLHEIGLLQGADESRARDLYDQACRGGDAHGCSNQERKGTR